MKNIFMKIFKSDSILFINSLFNNSKFLNFNALIFISIILYKFYNGLNFDIGLLSLIISFLISLIVSNFVLNKFNYSENFYLRLIQRFLIFNIIVIIIISLSIYICYFFNILPTVYCSDGSENNINNKIKEVVNINSETDKNEEYYNFKIDKNLVDRSLQNINDISKIALQKIIPNIGAGAAAGSAAASAIKVSSNLPPLQRATFIGGTTLITAASAKLGLDIGSTMSRNDNLQELIKDSAYSNPNINRTPSPGLDFINNVLESGDITSPLQDLLLYSFIADILIFFTIIIFLLIIINRYILSFNLNFISSLLNKIIPTNIKNWFNNKINTGIDYNNKFVLFIFIINIIVLILLILFKIIISSELLNNIDSYIEVHNYIHNK